MRLLPDTRGLPRAFWVLWAATFVDRVGGFVLPFLSIYLTVARGLSVEVAGAIAALHGLGLVLSGPLAGGLADRVGRRPVMIGAMTASALSLIGLSVVRDPVWIGVGVAAFGFLSSAARPALQASIADVVPPEDRARAFALLYWVINLAFAAASVLAGLLWKLGPTMLFVGDAATTLLCVGLIVGNVSETRDPSDAPSPTQTLLAPLRDRAFAHFVILTFVGAMVFGQVFVAMPIDMTAKGISPGVFGVLMAINGVLIVVLQPALSERASGYDPRRVMALGSVLVAAGFGLTAFATSPAAFGTCIAVWTVGEILWLPLIPAVTAASSPADLRASYQGASSLAWGAAALLAPLVGTFVIARASSAVLWCGCLAAGLVAAAGHWRAAGGAHPVPAPAPVAPDPSA
jgi:MFS family permease